LKNLLYIIAMNEKAQISKQGKKPLKRGFTTGACATGATKSALNALINGEFLDPVTIILPKGQKVSFDLERESQEVSKGIFAKTGIIKDAGDDPDITHGALIIAKISHAKNGTGISFSAGKGVGTITKAGLMLKIGQAAINPVPRLMMEQEIKQFCKRYKIAPDFNVEISVPNGKRLAKKTLNPRLGILGGLSILGTSGIVVPYSCSAWISSIHSGINVAKANGIKHIICATGNVSENAAKEKFNYPDIAYIEMGDFIGGTIKFLRKNPIDRISIVGGFAKISKLANGAMDLHSKRSEVDFEFLAKLAKQLGANEKLVQEVLGANTGKQVLELSEAANLPLAKLVAQMAQHEAQKMLKNNDIVLDVLITNRSGEIVGFSPTPTLPIGIPPRKGEGNRR